MSLVPMTKLLKRAESESVAVGAFSVGNMEMILGAVRAAEELHTPIILQIAETRLSSSPLSLIGPMMLAAAKSSSVDICVHLDHGLTLSTIDEALALGFSSVMLDASILALQENIQKTQEVVEHAKRFGASVEAELGVVGGNEGAGRHHEINCTDPKVAREFCEKTGIDALAIAIGNAHGHYNAKPELKLDILKETARLCSTPLVLHGGTGISDEQFRECIRLGIRKINIATASFDALTNMAQHYFHTTENPNYFQLSAAEADGVYENVKRHIQIFNMK